MGFGGHVLDMINRMAKNRAMQRHNRTKFSERREGLSNPPKQVFNHEKFSKLSEKEVEENEERIKQIIAKEKRKILILGFVLAALFIIGIVVLIRHFM